MPRATTIKASRVRNSPNNSAICLVCRKSFSRQADLRRHERIHSDDIEVRLPYKCIKCPKRFANKDALRPHMQSKHSSKTEYKCRICGDLHRTKSGLNHHENRHKNQTSTAEPKKDTRSQRSRDDDADIDSEMSDSSGDSDYLPSETSVSGDESTDSSRLSVNSLFDNSQDASYHTPDTFDPSPENSFASPLSPSSFISGAESSQNLEKDVLGGSSSSPSEFGSVLGANQRTDIQGFPVDNTITCDPIPLHAYLLDFSTGQIYYDPTAALLGAYRSQAVESNFELDPELEPYIYSPEELTPLSDLPEYQNYVLSEPPVVEQHQQPDASWEAWLAQGGEPTLTAYLNSSFPL